MNVTLIISIVICAIIGAIIGIVLGRKISEDAENRGWKVTACIVGGLVVGALIGWGLGAVINWGLTAPERGTTEQPVRTVIVTVEVVKTVEVVREVPAATLTPFQPALTPGPELLPSVGQCTKHGTVAWQNDNLLSGALYGEAPVGGLSEPCGVVAQTWTTLNGTERFVFYVPPYTVAWISGHRGGTGWYFDPSQDVNANLQQQADELLARDGAMKTTIAVLPGQTFRLVTRIQTSSTSAGSVGDTVGVCDANDAVGPAILEYGTGKPTVLKLNNGQTSSKFGGGCFAFDSQVALDARWPDHKAEFLTKYPDGQVIE